MKHTLLQGKVAMVNAECLFVKGQVPLTPGQKKVVDYLCSHAEEVIFMTAAQVARQLGISDSTVVRLAPVLGFESFKEMKQHLRGQLMERFDTISRMERTVGKISSVEDVLDAVMQADVNNLTRTAELIPKETFVQVVKILKETRDLHILGLRSAHSLAHFLASAMHFLRRRANLLIPGIRDLWGEISLLGGNSVLVAISFPRYTRLTVEAAQAAHEAGATVISVTDSILSPLAAYSDYVLPACYQLDSFVESYVAALSVLNALVTGVAFMDGAKAFARLKRMEIVWKARGIYYETESKPLPSWADEKV
jgi:DNA-binding MurR/RpiR family transcriptional regulator